MLDMLRASLTSPRNTTLCEDGGTPTCRHLPIVSATWILSSVRYAAKLEAAWQFVGAGSALTLCGAGFGYIAIVEQCGRSLACIIGQGWGFWASGPFKQ